MLIVVAVQPFVLLLSQYVSTRGRMVTAALAAMGAGNLVLPAGGHWLGMALLGLGFGVFVVASIAWAKETARPELLGKALGVYGFGAAIGGAVGAPIGLWLAQTVGVFGTAVAGGILAFGSVLVAVPTQTVPETTGGVTRSEDTESTRPGFQSWATLVALGGHLLAVTVYASALTSLSGYSSSQPWESQSLACGRLTGGLATNTWAPFHIGARARPACQCSCRIRLVHYAVAEACVQYRRWGHLRSHTNHCSHDPDEPGRHHGCHFQSKRCLEHVL